MATAVTTPKPRSRRAKAPKLPPRALRDAMAIAEEQGLLKGGRTMTIRGRMPEALVAEAKRNTGITSDSKLIEMALASVAVADNYGEWMASQRGSLKHITIDLDALLGD